MSAVDSQLEVKLHENRNLSHNVTKKPEKMPGFVNYIQKQVLIDFEALEYTKNENLPLRGIMVDAFLSFSNDVFMTYSYTMYTGCKRITAEN